MANSVEREKQQLGETADMLAITVLALTVLYSEGDYDAWDIVIAMVSFWLSRRRLKLFLSNKEELFNPARIIARIGQALSTAVFLFAAVELVPLHWVQSWIDISLLATTWLYNPDYQYIFIRTEFLHVLVAFAIFFLVARNDIYHILKRRRG